MRRVTFLINGWSGSDEYGGMVPTLRRLDQKVSSTFKLLTSKFYVKILHNNKIHPT